MPQQLCTAARATGPRARWDGAYWLVCAGFALVLAAVTTLTTHRVWGVCAAVGYAVAAVLAGRSPRPWGRAARSPRWRVPY